MEPVKITGYNRRFCLVELAEQFLILRTSNPNSLRYTFAQLRIAQLNRLLAA